MGNTISNINCPICKTESSKKRENTPYWICSFCDLWFQNPLPSKIYEATHEHPGDQMSENDKAINSNLATWLFKYTKLKKNDKALDIGSKYPYLSFCLKQAGVDAYGMDNIDVIPEYSKKLDVPMIKEDFEEWDPYKLGLYKLITLVHCFEHLYNPKNALIKLHSLLTEDGRIYIRSPANDVTGIERDLTEGHYTIHPYIHSLHSILELLAQLENLFVIEYCEDMHKYGQRDIILKPINKKPTIGIGMIVKNEERDLPVLLESIISIADSLVVVDTGSVDKTRNIVQKFAKNNNIPLEDFYYYNASIRNNNDWKLQDFSKARNQYLDKLNRQKIDWILTLDADDKVLDPRKIRRLSYLDCYDTFEMLIHPDKFTQHRMWKNNLGIKFEGAVHEYPCIGGFKSFSSGVGILHNYTPGSGESSNVRNLRILQIEHKNNPNSRNTFYLAQTHHHGSRYEEAIRYYDERIKMGEYYRDEWIFSHLYLARCARVLKLNDIAIKTLYRGIAENNNWAEFWMELAYIYYDLKEYNRTIACCLSSNSCTIESTGLWREENKYLDQPKRLLSFCYEALNNKDLALHWALKAKEVITGNDEEWDKRIYNLQPKLVGHSKLILLVRPGAIGDVIMTLNLIKPLKEKYPGCEIHYHTSESIANKLRNLMYDVGINTVYYGDLDTRIYDLKFNLIGYPLTEGYPYTPMKKHLLEYFADEVGVKISLNQHLELTWPSNPVFNPKTGHITIHPFAGWSKYKNWDQKNWEEVIKAFPDETFVQIGAKTDPKIEGAQHLFMGNFDISVKLVANAKLHLGVDSFTNHLTHVLWKKLSSKGPLYQYKVTPAIILWGSTQWQAAGYGHNINITSSPSCQPCFRENPEISNARTDPCPNMHICMTSIKPETVIHHIKNLINV